MAAAATAVDVAAAVVAEVATSHLSRTASTRLLNFPATGLGHVLRRLVSPHKRPASTTATRGAEQKLQNSLRPRPEHEGPIDGYTSGM